MAQGHKHAHGRHGAVRGLSTTLQSIQFDGRFGRIFRTLPAAQFSLDALAELGNAMTSPAEDSPTPETQIDGEENPGIDAGYTYLGQFIDHDLTFDPMSSLIKQNDPDALVDFRTPRFDLDNLYGRGPDDQPYLYEKDGLHLQLGTKMTGNPHDEHTRDLPRHLSISDESGDAVARALIGDPRNDENVIVGQLQATMIRFHNKMVDENEGAELAEIQRIVRWHYQYVILHDFLPTILGKEMVFKVLPHLKSGKSIFVDRPNIRFYHFRNEPFMPVEFSVAAYRFGHSMVRPIYRLNTTLGKPKPPKDDPANGRLVIFDAKGDKLSLTGFQPPQPNWAIDWRLFFPLRKTAPLLGVDRLQKAYKIDTSLVNPLGTLPHSIAPSGPHALATRNLERGNAMGLPSGQDVARAMDVEPIEDKKLVIGKATTDDKPVFKSIVDLTDHGREFVGKAPLWYYILAEAQQQFKKKGDSIHLGEVGGRIVMETFAGLLLGDSHSYLSQDPGWTPKNRNFGISDLIKIAIS